MMKAIVKSKGFKAALFILASIVVIYIFRSFIVSNMIHRDCAWNAEAGAWLDQNRNGEWENDEPPLQFVKFAVDDVRNDYQDVNSIAVSNKSGKANLDVWMPGCPRVSFEVYAEQPPGYEQTTLERYPAKGDDGEGPFYFGFAVPPGAPTPTPRPESELVCQQAGASSQPIWGFSVAPDETVWVLGYSIQRFDSSANRLELPVEIPAEHGVSVMEFRDNGEIWLGNHALVEGLFWFDGNQWTYFTTDEGLADNHINDIDFDDNGTVWIATNNGISNFSPENDTWTTYNIFPIEVERLGFDPFVKIIFAPDQSIWFLEDYHAIARLIPNEGTFEEEIVIPKGDESAPLYNYNNAFFDKNSGLWLDSAWGIARYDLETKTWDTYNSEATDGALPPVIITDMARGHDGKIWLGTYQNGIVTFEPHGSMNNEGTWTLFQDNRLLSDHGVRLIIHPDGSIWMATIEGDQILRCVENN